ncbi:MAG: hypothetical protein Q7R97_00910 [Candidatus Daviesbacteria bacterium]|nr:hypothetical protein [Candidatus Daviesbacteria bacterium]
MPEFINPLPDHIEMSEKKLFSKKNVMTFLVIAIGLLVIPFSVRMLEQANIIQIKATGDEITFVQGDNIDCTTGNTCKAIGTKFQVLLKSPLGPPGTPVPTQPPTVTPLPTITPGGPTPTPVPVNLLNANMQNRTLPDGTPTGSGPDHYAINEPWFYDPGTYTLSGSGVCTGNGCTWDIRADTYFVNSDGVTPDSQRGTQNSYRNTTFTLPAGQMFTVILQLKSGDTATFSNVSLVRISTQ